MKKMILMVSVLTSSLFSWDIHVKIVDIKNTDGKMYIGLYNKAEGFTEISKTFREKIANIKSNKLVYTFKNVPTGDYAISVFHDENNNQELDTNIVGIPKEDYGFSNNHKFLLRGATFEESMFHLDKNKSLTITLGE